MKVEKEKFDAALSALLKADPIPLSEIPKRDGTSRRPPRKPTKGKVTPKPPEQ
jgi:hypothetical protein